MNSSINTEAGEEIKLKISEDLNNQAFELSKSNLVESTQDFNLKCKKVRLVFNKVTEENYEKHINDLVNNFEYNSKLILELVRIIFDRATSKNFSQLYLNIVSHFSNSMKPHCYKTYKLFKEALQSKSSEILVIKDQSLVAIAKFAGLLFKEGLIKATVFFQFLEISLKDQSNAFLVEATCQVMKLFGPYLYHLNPNHVQRVIEELGALNLSTHSKKLAFLVLDIIENKVTIMTPRAILKKQPVTQKPSPGKTGKGVSFATAGEFQPIQTPLNKRILKQGVSEETKSALRAAVGEHMAGKSTLEICKEIFKNNQKNERQLVNQMFKYALIQYDREQEFIRICELITRTSEELNKKEVIETGIMYTVEAIDDIKLDSPLAPQHLIFMINHLHGLGIIEDSKYLLDRFNS